MPSPMPSRGQRLTAACAIAMVAVALRVRAMHVAPGDTTDFAQLWVGARELLAGRDPYAAVGPGRLLEWHTSLVFPLPAVLAAVPFTALSRGVAEIAFAALGVAVLAYVLAARGWDRLCWFASFPVFYAVLRVQWSPLLTAAALVPALGALLVCKPTIGAALAVYRPTRAMVVGCLALLAVSLAVSPDWPRHWLGALHEPTLQRADRPVVLTTYLAPVLQPGGFLILLAALKWRRPEARLLVALACVPQTPVAYEMVPLVLVAGARVELLLLTVLSWGMYAALLHYRTFGDWEAIARISGIAEVWLLLIPATVFVLRRPNVGDVPLIDWLRTRARRATARPGTAPLD